MEINDMLGLKFIQRINQKIVLYQKVKVVGFILEKHSYIGKRQLIHLMVIFHWSK